MVSKNEWNCDHLIELGIILICHLNQLVDKKCPIRIQEGNVSLEWYLFQRQQISKHSFLLLGNRKESSQQRNRFENMNKDLKFLPAIKCNTTVKFVVVHSQVNNNNNNTTTTTEDINNLITRYTNIYTWVSIQFLCPLRLKEFFKSWTLLEM